ncbi:MAG TPA: hypothetical protein VFV96_01465 [Verrucomicrobiae bacterium]|nr:hypothetical protein [Verrucomicrobiae bacterium]
MNALPVLIRELRAESRHDFTYWLRVLGAGAVLGAAIFLTLGHRLRAEDGGRLFTALHGTLQLAIWVLVPLLTADCVSRERREGTLGLLFLTPLRAHDIVMAKGLTHALRAASLLAAAVPIVTLPLLMGGVSWQQAASSLLLNAGAIVLALTAGMLASALSRSWVRALILAYLFAGGLAFLFCVGLGGALTVFLPGNPFWNSESWAEVGAQVAAGLNPALFMSGFYYRSGFGPVIGATSVATFRSILFTSGSALLMALLVLGLALLTAARLMAGRWQETPPPPWLVRWRQRLCTPVVMLGLLRRWMKHKLEHNPVGWLEQRTWSGRLVVWGWLAAMISTYSLLLTDSNFYTRSFATCHDILGWTLVVSMAINASLSFRRERESRVLELLLVSPLREGEIILGRLRGLWGQFLPAMVFLLLGWTYLSTALHRMDDDFPTMLRLAVRFITVPVVGLYFSLVCRNFLTALLLTLLVGLAVPLALRSLLVQLVIVCFLWVRLRIRLERRQFATESA